MPQKLNLGWQKYGFQARTGESYEVLRNYFCKKLIMITKEWYKDWFNSPYYHKLYFERDEKEAQTFLHQLLSYLKPAENSKILDVACGRGRHSRFLASLGYDVTGIDISLDSIQYAGQFENDHLQFYQHDMRLPFWINYFDYALNMFTSFGYFATRREHDDAIRTIVNSVNHHGTVLLDYLNAHYIEEHLKHNEIKTIDNVQYEIHRWMDEKHFYKKIIISNHTLDKPLEYTEKVAKFSLGDFMEMLSYQKMQVVDVFGDYELNSYNVRKTPRMIIVAKKS
jgi:SAM-dependent methyltransferase